jgi:hypothetical protein
VGLHVWERQWQNANVKNEVTMKLKVVIGLALLALAMPGTAQADGAGLSVSGVGDVGTVTQNQTGVDATFSVSDTGVDPLDVTQSLNAPGWSVIQDTCSGVQLAPSGICQIVVTLDTSNTGSFPGQLTINAVDSTDSSSASTVEQLTATVAQPLPPPVQVVSTSLTPGAFYPLVRDGYRDTATYHFTLNEPANGTVQVRNHIGRVVKSFKFNGQQSMTVKWNGRNKHDRKVKPGTFRFRVKARNATNGVTSANRKIEVKTALVTRHATIDRPGHSTTSRSSGAYTPGGNCNFSGDGFGGGITTCLFAHASLNYTFTTRRHSTFESLSHRVTNGLEPCRNSGWSVTHRRGTRTWHAIFTHGSVNDFSQCDVEHLSFHYNYKKRI